MSFGPPDSGTSGCYGAADSIGGSTSTNTWGGFYNAVNGGWNEATNEAGFTSDSIASEAYWGSKAFTRSFNEREAKLEAVRQQVIDYGVLFAGPTSLLDLEAIGFYWGRYTEPGFYKTMDEAAIAATDYIRDNFQYHEYEYGGYIYGIGDYYSFAMPVKGTERELDKSKFNKVPDGTSPVAIYHTHPGRGYNVFNFSPEDYIASGGHPIYLGAGLRIKSWSAAGGERRIR